MELVDDENKSTKHQSIIESLKKGYFTSARLLIETNSCDFNEASKIEISPKMANSIFRIQSFQYPVSGRTPLMYCSLIEDDTWSYSLAQMLVEKGASLSLKDNNGLNALMYACLYQRIKLVSLFLNAMGDFNILDCDSLGNTALHLASLGRNQAICNLLVEKCLKYNINETPKNKAGIVPIQICQQNRHDRCVSLINTISTKVNKNVITSAHLYLFNSNSSANQILSNQNETFDPFLIPILEPYKLVYLSKELMIKKSCLNQKSINKKVDLLQKRSKTAQFKLNTIEKEPRLSNRSLDNLPKVNSAKYKNSHKKNESFSIGWRNNVNHIFDIYEWSLSDSYRKSCGYVPTYLEQLGFMKQLLHQNSTSNQSRKSVVTKTNSKMTMNMSRRTSHISFTQN